MLITLIRTVLLYGLLILSVRMMGKRQVAEMEPAEFVVTMLLANLASVPMQDNGLPLLSGIVPIFTVLSMELILAVLSLKFIPLRRVLCGVPTLLINNGVVDQKALSVSRVSLDELCQKLREKNIFDLSTVKYAILETDGELSVMPDPSHKPVTVGDAGLPEQPSVIPYTIISDGILLKENLRQAGKNTAWLQKLLRSRACRQRDVFLLTADNEENIVLIRKEKK